MEYSIDHPPRIPSDRPLPDTADARLIEQAGLGGLVSLTARWLDRCRAMGVLVGPGRGSAVASPTLRALNIVCPALPESDPRRFVSPDKHPDIDIDVAASQRDWALELLARQCPEGFAPIIGVNANGEDSPCAVFIAPDRARDIIRSIDARTLESHGWPRLDILASVELDTIRLAAALAGRHGGQVWRAAVIASDLTWAPLHTLTPTPSIDWTPRATADDWQWITAAPRAFFQLRKRDRMPPVSSFDGMTRALALMRPGCDRRMPFQETQMAALEQAGVCSFTQADLIRHAGEQERAALVAAAERVGGDAALAARLLTGGYGYAQAHAIGYAAILDMEVRIASRSPWAWAAALYDTDPARPRDSRAFADRKSLRPLTGVWKPDPALGPYLGGVAHARGVGPVQAHAIRQTSLTGEARRPDVDARRMTLACRALAGRDIPRFRRLLDHAIRSSLPFDVDARLTPRIPKPEPEPEGEPDF